MGLEWGTLKYSRFRSSRRFQTQSSEPNRRRQVVVALSVNLMLVALAWKFEECEEKQQFLLQKRQKQMDKDQSGLQIDLGKRILSCWSCHDPRSNIPRRSIYTCASPIWQTIKFTLIHSMIFVPPWNDFQIKEGKLKMIILWLSGWESWACSTFSRIWEASSQHFSLGVACGRSLWFLIDHYCKLSIMLKTWLELCLLLWPAKMTWVLSRSQS